MRSAVKFCLELCHTCEKKSSIAAYSVKLCIHTQDSTATTGHTLQTHTRKSITRMPLVHKMCMYVGGYGYWQMTHIIMYKVTALHVPS